MSDGTPEDREKEIQEILSDLDTILKSATGAAPSKEGAPPPAPAPEPPKPKAEPPQRLEIPPIGAPPEPAAPPPPAKAPETPAAAPEVELGARSLPPAAAPKASDAALPRDSARSAAPPPKPGPAVGGIKGGEPPANVPKEQVRRIAFLYAPGRKEDYERFATFVSEVAMKVSKKPIHIHKAFVLELSGGSDPTAVLQRVKESGAVGCLAVLAGLKDSFVRDIEDAFSAQDFFLRVVVPEDAAKRTAAIDLVVDMMLLKAG